MNTYLADRLAVCDPFADITSSSALNPSHISIKLGSMQLGRYSNIH